MRKRLQHQQQQPIFGTRSLWTINLFIDCWTLILTLWTMRFHPASAFVISLPDLQAVQSRVHRRNSQRKFYFTQSIRYLFELFAKPEHNNIPIDNANTSTQNISHISNEQDRQIKYQQLQESSLLQLAPMMEYTDRHFRHLVRLISKRTLLYTEMHAANAIAHERQNKINELLLSRGETEESMSSQKDIYSSYDDYHLKRYLGQSMVSPLEGASVLQLGGSNPDQLHQATRCVLEMTNRNVCDYTALNLNCGCPSPKVAGKGCFGAALMDHPFLVADLTQAMHEGCDGRLPIIVKCRIGTDTHLVPTTNTMVSDSEEDQYHRLCHFIETVAANGIVRDFVVHARIAVLQKSFSPADNRKIPKLKYELVRRLVRDYPDLTFTLNGGVDSIAQVQHEIKAAPGLNGVMTGRAWVADPWSFAMADAILYNDHSNTDRDNWNRLEVLKAYGRHADMEEANGDPTRIRRSLVKAISPLFAGEANAKRYRIALDEIARRPKQLLSEGKSLEKQPPLSDLILQAAMENLTEETLLRTPQESYDRILWEEQKKATGQLENNNGRSTSIQDWQMIRKEEEEEEETARNTDPYDDQIVASV